MHFLMVTTAIVMAFFLRWTLPKVGKVSVWVQFLLPPLLLLTTAIAVVGMGNQGSMFGKHVGMLSNIAYGIGWVFLVVSLGILISKGCQGWHSLKALTSMPPAVWQGHGYLLLDSDRLVAARVGFWQSQLVLSKGILEKLSPAHIEAIICHESAHSYYRDTFWFFWWGWLKQITVWLPYSEILWTELLLVRELRADQWAKQCCDYLILAEALLLVAEDRHHPHWQMALSAHIGDRLEQRIAWLLEQEEVPPTSLSTAQLSLMGLGLVPLLIVPFHSL